MVTVFLKVKVFLEFVVRYVFSGGYSFCEVRVEVTVELFPLPLLH
jgi:hypothetical protein